MVGGGGESKFSDRLWSRPRPSQTILLFKKSVFIFLGGGNKSNSLSFGVQAYVSLEKFDQFDPTCIGHILSKEIGKYHDIANSICLFSASKNLSISNSQNPTTFGFIS